jgi:hypothetical protein
VEAADRLNKQDGAERRRDERTELKKTSFDGAPHGRDLLVRGIIPRRGGAHGGSDGSASFERDL